MESSIFLGSDWSRFVSGGGSVVEVNGVSGVVVFVDGGVVDS